jgi:hypothetical protein
MLLDNTYIKKVEDEAREEKTTQNDSSSFTQSCNLSGPNLAIKEVTPPHSSLCTGQLKFYILGVRTSS